MDVGVHRVLFQTGLTYLAKLSLTSQDAITMVEARSCPLGSGTWTGPLWGFDPASSASWPQGRLWVKLPWRARFVELSYYKDTE